MSLSTVAFASGLSSLLIVLIGLILGLYMLKRYLSSPDNNTLALAVILISVGSVWSAIAVNFIIALLAGSSTPQYLEQIPYLMLVGWIPGVVGLATAYILVSIVREKYLKLTLLIFGIFFVLNTVIIYILIPLNVPGFKVDDALTFSTPADGLPNASTAGYFLILSVISIVIMLATALLFIVTALKTTIPLVKTRAGLLGTGFLLISVFLTFDSIIATDNLIILLTVRIIVVIGLFILAMAITLPKRIFKNLA